MESTVVYNVVARDGQMCLQVHPELFKVFENMLITMFKDVVYQKPTYWTEQFNRFNKLVPRACCSNRASSSL